MARWTSTASRYFHTLRHLRPVQTVGRLVVESRRKAGWVRVPDPPTGLVERGEARVPFLRHDPWNSPAALAEGRWTFLDETRDLGWPPRWAAAADAPLLWQFNLHYHSVLAVLPAEEQRALARSWVAAHPTPEGVAWHPYPTALRIVHWVHAGLASEPDLAASLYRQAAWLLRVREVYHPGNHLIENARALVLAGATLAGQGEADRWREVGLRTLRAETPEQILPDGGYFERSPMYHALMLVAYGDVLNVLPPGHPDEDWLAAAIGRMADALASVRHPDGTLPLFNDASEEIAPGPDAVLAYAAALTGRPAVPVDALPDTGHFVLRDAGAHVVVDAGPIGPDHLPAHAHADVFTFEASFGGHRFVVDTGVLEYTAGPARDHDRSTAAHNTLEVNGVSQAECWGSFRVARRFAPQAVAFSDAADLATVSATFPGYASLIGDDIVHTRRFQLDRARRVLRVEDTVDGAGEHESVARLHLHPAVRLGASPDGYLLSRDGVTVLLKTDGAHPEVTETRYSPRFGSAVSRSCLAIRCKGPLPHRLYVDLHY